MLKFGSKRRRTRAEVLADKAAAKAKDLEIQEKLAELEELKKEKLLAALDKPQYKVAAGALDMLIKRGVLAVDAEGTVGAVPNHQLNQKD